MLLALSIALSDCQYVLSLSICGMLNVIDVKVSAYGDASNASNATLIGRCQASFQVPASLEVPSLIEQASQSIGCLSRQTPSWMSG